MPKLYVQQYTFLLLPSMAWNLFIYVSERQIWIPFWMFMKVMKKVATHRFIMTVSSENCFKHSNCKHSKVYSCSERLMWYLKFSATFREKFREESQLPHSGSKLLSGDIGWPCYPTPSKFVALCVLNQTHILYSENFHNQTLRTR